LALEAVHHMRRAHVVVATHAVAALPARHDLLAGDTVTLSDAPPPGRLVVERHHRADELMPRDHLGLGPGRPGLVAPELSGTVLTLQVTGTDADRVDLHQCLPGPGRGHRDLCQGVVLRTVADDGLHHRRNGC